MKAEEDTTQADRIDPTGMNLTRIEAACNSVVAISGNIPDYNYSKHGAGVIIDPRGYIITNNHVIDGMEKIEVKTYDDMEYVARCIGHDPGTDLALIKISPTKPLVPIRIGDSSKIHVLERVVVVGHPFGYSFSCNSGEISGISRIVPIRDNLKYNNMIQISTGIDTGSSGCPLLNTDGEMIGSIVGLSQSSMPLVFALPSDFVMEVAAGLLEQHTHQFCRHGIRFKEIDVHQIGTRQINVDDYKILAIASIDPGSPAEEAGLLPGDVLRKANGQTLDRKLDWYRALLDKKFGDVISLVFERDGVLDETDLALKSPKREQPKQPQTPPSSQTDSAVNDVVWDKFGIRVTPVSQEEFEQRNAGLKSEYAFEGAVEVQEVKPDGIFASRKVQKGDMLAAIITPKDPWNITRVADLTYLADRWTPDQLGGNEVQVIVVRDKTLLRGTVPVPKTDQQPKPLR